MHTQRLAFIAVILAALLSGCATERYVNQKTAAMGTTVNARTDNEMLKLETRLNSLQSGLDKQATGTGQQMAGMDSRISKVEGNLGVAHRLAQEALDRANASHQLAQGKLAYQVTLNDSQVKFDIASTTLNKQAVQVLTDVVNKIKAENRNVYVEIQGHTDNQGDKAENKQLGLERAESVREFLHKAGLPLHRLNVISYGSSQPVAPGNSSKARAQNRRVVLMVLI